MFLIVLTIIVFFAFIAKIIYENAAANKREGNEGKTLAQSALIGGIGCFAVPAVLMVVILLFAGIVWAFFSVKMLFDLGHPITIFFGICIIVGSIGILYSSIKG